LDIGNRDQLENWLKGQTPEVAAAIALRTALRALPVALNLHHFKGRTPQPALTAALFRCCSISWVACNSPTQEIAAARAAAYAAARAAAYAAAYAAARAAAYGAADAAARAAARAAAYAAADAAARAAAYAAADAADAAADAAAYAADAAADAAAYAAAYAAIWRAVESDCTALAAGGSPQALLAQPLWPGAIPDWAQEDIKAMEAHLATLGAGFDLWAAWYRRRLTGTAAGFGLPPEGEEEIARRLIHVDDAWWEREPALVNGKIRGWIEELTPKEPTEAGLAQNPLALTFAPDADGRIGLRTDYAPGLLLNDQDAQDRHQEARAEALHSLAKSARELTQAFEIGTTVESYLEALGETLEGARPSLLVLRGEKLRRLMDAHNAPDAMLPPFSEEQALAFASWRMAHNALVGLDPHLSNIERASYGPDVPQITIELDAIKAIIKSADRANIPTDEAREALNDSADNVPVDAAPDDRRLLSATENLKNFIRGTAGWIWRNKGKVAVGTYGAALWIQRNIDWLREVFANHPSILELINWIASLPL
jgi:hypothetical protein